MPCRPVPLLAYFRCLVTLKHVNDLMRTDCSSAGLSSSSPQAATETPCLDLMGSQLVTRMASELKNKANFLTNIFPALVFQGLTFWGVSPSGGISRVRNKILARIWAQTCKILAKTLTVDTPSQDCITLPCIEPLNIPALGCTAMQPISFHLMSQFMIISLSIYIYIYTHIHTYIYIYIYVYNVYIYISLSISSCQPVLCHVVLTTGRRTTGGSERTHVTNSI